MATATRYRPRIERHDHASASGTDARGLTPTATTTALPTAAATQAATLAVLALAAAVALTGLLAVLTSSRIGAPPFAGRWRLAAPSPAGAVAAAAVAGTVVALATRTTYVARVRWRWLLAGSMLGALAWAVSLALVDGPPELLGSLGGRFDYLAAVADAGSPGAFLDRFLPEHRSWPLHVQGHPPGMVLLLLGLDTVGLARTGVVAAIVLVGGAAAVPAVLVATRDVAGDVAARRLAPALVLTPSAIWWSSADALFTGVAAWALALAVLATSRRGPASWAMGAGAGVLGAGAFMLSYGLVPLAAVPLAAGVWRRRLAPLAATAAVIAAAYLAMRAAGFDWWRGLEATRAAYGRGIAGDRPYGVFLVANLAVFATAVGPAAIAGMLRLVRAGRRAPLLMLAGAAAAAVAAANVSGLSKGEVERIWLPFAPWTTVAAAVHREPRPWLVASGVTAVVLALVLEARW
jgi:methylthioxylose transferase